MMYNVVYPFHYTVTADTYNEAIKNFVKVHRDMNINHIVIKDQNKYMEARVRRYYQDGRNFMGLNVYPIENPFINDPSGNHTFYSGQPGSYPYSGFMGAAAMPGFAQTGMMGMGGYPGYLPTVLATGTAPKGTKVLSTSPPGSRIMSPYMSPYMSPVMGGISPFMSGPMMTGINRSKGAPLMPATPLSGAISPFMAGSMPNTPTSVFPTWDQSGNKMMTMATTPVISPGLGLVSPVFGATPMTTVTPAGAANTSNLPQAAAMASVVSPMSGGWSPKIINKK